MEVICQEQLAAFRVLAPVVVRARDICGACWQWCRLLSPGRRHSARVVRRVTDFARANANANGNANVLPTVLVHEVFSFGFGAPVLVHGECACSWVLLLSGDPCLLLLGTAGIVKP